MLRVLDPAEICHGMNYFWRGVHLATDGVKLPVFVHANGVDEKIYFMRDRGTWVLMSFLFWPSSPFNAIPDP